MKIIKSLSTSLLAIIFILSLGCKDKKKIGDDVAYFTADLTPGKYALVAEIPDPASNQMLKTFEIGMDKL